MNIHIERPDDLLTKIISSCFPDYKGKTIKLSDNPPKDLDSYWVDGSKNSFVFYDLSTGKLFDVKSNHPMFEANNPRHLDKLPENIALVKHCIFCGKDLGITVYLHPKNITPFLPERIELTTAEQIVLHVTSSFISSCRRQKAKRLGNLSTILYDNAMALLIDKGLLNKNGAITSKGRNALSFIDRSNLL